MGTTSIEEELEEIVTGHERLVADTEALAIEARDFVFHDYKSAEATPKMYLRERLMMMAQGVVDGNYDNDDECEDCIHNS